MIFEVMTVFFSGVGAASLAKLTFMVGGVEEEFNAAQELLTSMGANAVYCGQVGSGQVNTHKHECPLACNQLKLLVKRWCRQWNFKIPFQTEILEKKKSVSPRIV